MSWTYSGDPTTSPLDEVRYLIGDTNPASPMLLDSEILYNIASVYGDVRYAPMMGNFLPAAFAADNIAGKYAGMTDKSVGDLHVSYGQQFKQYQQLAVRLRARATNALVPPFVGGRLYSEKWANARDRDMILTAARIDGMSNAGSTSRMDQQNTDSSFGP